MASIRDVAKRSGFSITTVSHALNRPDRVTAEVRKRVMRAVEELNYRPNPIARSLRSGKSRLIAVMIPDICNPWFPQLVKVVQQEVAKEDFDVLIYNTDVPAGTSERHVENYLWQFSTNRFAGVMIVGESFAKIEDQLQEVRIPGVYVGHLSEQRFDTITVNDYQGAYDATHYLIERGYQRIATITGEQIFLSGSERLRGYTQALLDSDRPLQSEYVFAGTYLRPSGREGIRHLLSLRTPPDAVFVANGLMALGALGTALDMQRRVPEDIAIFTFDNMEELLDVRPTLSTVDYDPQIIGRAAISRLLQRIAETAPREPENITVPHSLILRNSA
jgi:DNA-binding LacI/PurR family transcriptional regulator